MTKIIYNGWNRIEKFVRSLIAVVINHEQCQKLLNILKNKLDKDVIHMKILGMRIL